LGRVRRGGIGNLSTPLKRARQCSGLLGTSEIRAQTAGLVTKNDKDAKEIVNAKNQPTAATHGKPAMELSGQ